MLLPGEEPSTTSDCSQAGQQCTMQQEQQQQQQQQQQQHTRQMNVVLGKTACSLALLVLLKLLLLVFYKGDPTIFNIQESAPILSTAFTATQQNTHLELEQV